MKAVVVLASVVVGATAAPCDCKYYGTELSKVDTDKYPTADPGNHTGVDLIAKYGTMCAAWDSMPGSPWYSSCDDKDTSTRDHNWCVLAWCYVDEGCAGAEKTDVFPGSDFYFSYEACGSLNCYSDPEQNGCPQPPVHDTADKCACLNHGSVLAADILTNFPSQEPGRYKDLPFAKYYGTVCAAWDITSGMPYSDYCTSGTDFCDSGNNWCTAPWCYVDKDCPTAVPSAVFNGSAMAYYSYNTCRDTPDCFTNVNEPALLPSDCPFDKTNSNSWYTSAMCNNEFTGSDCACKYYGKDLPKSILDAYPLTDPGNHAGIEMIAKYGTMCAAWDRMPGTPWHSSCDDEDLNAIDNNWCQLAWCYVDKSCKHGKKSAVFDDDDTYFSYVACGSLDCYTYKNQAGCPQPPVYEAGANDYCKCLSAGSVLDEKVYEDNPTSEPGKYRNLTYVKYYGTSCAAWDISPGMPYSEYCTSSTDLCSYTSNWCGVPWCYVDKDCPTAVPSAVFDGSAVAYFSYNTCRKAPDCFTNSAEDMRADLPAECPFDITHDSNWYTSASCLNGWTAEPSSPSPSQGGGHCVRVSEGEVMALDQMGWTPRSCR